MKEKQTLEEFINSQPYYGHGTPEYLEGIEVGAKWQAERMYSEEEVLEVFEHFKMDLPFHYEFLVKEHLQQLKQQEQ